MDDKRINHVIGLELVKRSTQSLIDDESGIATRESLEFTLELLRGVQGHMLKGNVNKEPLLPVFYLAQMFGDYGDFEPVVVDE